MRWWCWCRGDVGGKAPPRLENVKMVVERRGKMLCRVTRGDGCNGDVGVGGRWR